MTGFAVLSHQFRKVAHIGSNLSTRLPRARGGCTVPAKRCHINAIVSAVDTIDGCETGSGEGSLMGSPLFHAKFAGHPNFSLGNNSSREAARGYSKRIGENMRTGVV